MYEGINRRGAERIFEIDQEEAKEIEVVDRALSDWRFEQGQEFERQKRQKIEAGEVRKGPK
jgi:hypothetical protein